MRIWLAMLVAGVLAPAAVMSQSEQLPHGREGWGPSWMPDSTPVFAHHFRAGDWMLMLHYAANPLLGGEITFRSMLSAEPATAGGPCRFRSCRHHMEGM